jgi:hypothetical protein
MNCKPCLSLLTRDKRLPVRGSRLQPRSEERRPRFCKEEENLQGERGTLQGFLIRKKTRTARFCKEDKNLQGRGRPCKASW